MAEGIPSLERNIYLSSLAPGVGKTTAVTHAIRQLIARDEYRHVGVIFFLARVEEITKLVDTMGLTERDFSVMVSDSYRDANAHGNQEKSNARVMFTTQQMLMSRRKGHDSFAEISDFHWNGRPRSVRIWDEAISPAHPITLGDYQIASLLQIAARNGSLEFANALDLVRDCIRNASDGDLIHLPELTGHGISLTRMRNWYEVAAQKNICEALFELAGQQTRVRKDIGNTAVHYKDVLPRDLGPTLVLDASGTFRKVYEFWHMDRQGLVALPSAPKSYSGLTVRFWDRGMGYKSRNHEGEIVVEGILKAIRSIPYNERILVIHHIRNSSGDFDWRSEIEQHLDRDTVNFCTWGRHTATNTFAQCRHIILVGPLLYAVSQYEAIARGAKGLIASDELSRDDFNAVRLGEIAHNIFQAACRGMIRYAENGNCPTDCHLYVIASSHSKAGVSRELLADIFPGATVEDWLPIIQLSGHAAELAKLLSKQPLNRAIAKRDLLALLKFSHLQELNRLLKRTDVKAALLQSGRELHIGRGTIVIRNATRIDDRHIELAMMYPFFQREGAGSH